MARAAAAAGAAWKSWRRLESTLTSVLTLLLLLLFTEKALQEDARSDRAITSRGNMVSLQLRFVTLIRMHDAST